MPVAQTDRPPQLDEDAAKVWTHPIEGPAVGRRFTLRFTGATNLASARAKECFGKLYDKANRTWKKFEIPSPDGQSTFQPMVFEHVGLREDRLQGAMRRAAYILREQYPSKKVSVDRRTHSVSVNLLQVVRAESPSADVINFRYKTAHLAKLGLDKDAIRAAIDAPYAAAGSDEGWDP